MKKLLKTNEAAALLNMSAGTLQNMRVTGRGPRYVQSTPRGAVRYTEESLQEWMQQRERSNTSEASDA